MRGTLHVSHLQGNQLTHIASERILKVLGRWVEVNNVHKSAHAFAVRVQLLAVSGLPNRSRVSNATPKPASLRACLAAASWANDELRIAPHSARS